MKREKTQREALDFYPTPREVTHVVVKWLTDREAFSSTDQFLDPAAGEGDLIEAARDFAPLGEAFWHAIELHDGRGERLEDYAESVTVGDALALEWPEASVLSNPPFSLLDGFWCRMAEHCARHRVWGAALTPIAWWNAVKRGSYRRPDAMLSLGWRPSFRAKGGPAHKGKQDFCWSVIAPDAQKVTEWYRVEKPTISAPFATRAQAAFSFMVSA